MPSLIATKSITAPQRLVKGTLENRVYAMEFAKLLAQGEILSSITSIAALPTGTGTDLVISGQVISGTQVQCRISGGKTETTFAVTIVVVTSLSNTLEGRGILIVAE